MKRIIAITGPTASGKSAAALELCQRIGGEIVSLDSMQIYKGMDIGTAKPTPEEQRSVPHHMIDIVTPDINFSCADYAQAASGCIEDIFSRRKIPVICGGTGLYFERLFCTSALGSPPCDPAVRGMLEKRSPEENYSELLLIDPESAASTHMNNRKRVIRALEIYRCSGKTKSEWDRESRQSVPGYDLKHITLTSSDRGYLYNRIDRRVDKMIEDGLVDEVTALGLSPDSTAGQAIGYKEIIAYLEGRITSLDEAVGLIKQGSRNYAKRQLTWFRRYRDAHTIDISIDPGKTCEIIVNFTISLVE